jgi:hypothetical protein
MDRAVRGIGAGVAEHVEPDRSRIRADGAITTPRRATAAPSTAARREILHTSTIKSTKCGSRSTLNGPAGRETVMSRISIDVTDAEHAKLKALAALKGQSIKDFVLSRTIGDTELAPHLAELEALLDERIDRARAEGTSDRSVNDIFEQARPDGGTDGDA